MRSSLQCSIYVWLISSLIVLFPNLANPAESIGSGDQSIRLLSNEAADICIKDADCMYRLFVQAAFGGDGTPDSRPLKLFKWQGAISVASLSGDELAGGVQSMVNEALQRMHHLSAIAGSTFNQARGDSRQKVNFVLLISDDFARDRDTAFADLLADVFAGRSELYDELSTGASPICRGQLFAERDASIGGGLGLIESDVDEAAFQRCLHRVALNVLGLRHPLPDDIDSVLSPTSERQAWTSIDFMLLRMLSDPAIVPGMSQDELNAVFPSVHQRALHPSS